MSPIPPSPPVEQSRDFTIDPGRAKLSLRRDPTDLTSGFTLSDPAVQLDFSLDGAVSLRFSSEARLTKLPSTKEQKLQIEIAKKLREAGIAVKRSSLLAAEIINLTKE